MQLTIYTKDVFGLFSSNIKDCQKLEHVENLDKSHLLDKFCVSSSAIYQHLIYQITYI